jgi:hypothetical protein
MNQKSILLNYLRQHGRTKCADLERFCDVRSVTTRMSELIRSGAPILKTCEFEPDSRGRMRRVTYYEIAPDPAQSELFQSDEPAPNP